MPTVEVTESSGKRVAASLYHFPPECPTCHRLIEPKFVTGWKRHSSVLEAVFVCPAADCGHALIADYGSIGTGWRFNGIRSVVPPTKEFSPTIDDVSADFVGIYNEAFQAEQLHLTRIAGAGYRKALEFLIKDYLIKKGAASAEVIGRTALGSCINTYVDEPLLKGVASRAAWLGNDETHYERLWEGRTIEDMRNLIDLAIRWIELHELSEKAVRDMPNPRA